MFFKKLNQFPYQPLTIQSKLRAMALQESTAQNPKKGMPPKPPKLETKKENCFRYEKEELGPPCSGTETLFSSSELRGEWCGGVDGGGGGRGSGGGGGDGGLLSDDTDAYYLKMIEANPGNGLLLGNYAKFLTEVKGDYDRAEEYCERAIVANPSDGTFHSLYADLIWLTYRTARRAETYYDQAVKSAPDDSYILASYAKFLWDAEDEEVSATSKHNADDRKRISGQCVK